MKKVFAYLIILLFIPLIIISYVLLKIQKYNLVAIIIALLSIIPFFLYYESKKRKAKEIVCLAVMVALAVASRAVFVFTPGFKPIAAIIIITGIYFNGIAGFMCGALSALLSNIIFGQGPWTVFQMFGWGMIGFIAGILSNPLKNIWILILYGLISGVFFSLTMDIYTVLSVNPIFSIELYYLAIIESIQFMVVYIVSNIIFIVVLNKPIGNQLNRMKLKYGIFCK